MNISRIVSKTRKLVSDNSPVLLTAVGVTGVVTTAYLAAKASFKAAPILATAEVKKNVDKDSDAPFVKLTNKERFDLIWKLYIPAVSTGAVTCTSIVFANRIGTKRAAALATAYSLSERAFAEYKDKVVEQIGKEKEGDIRKEIVKDRLAAAPPNTEMLIAETGKVLCHDAYSGRYFMSSKNEIEAARNHINYEILKVDHATLAEFYSRIGLDNTSVSEEMGWNSENPLEIGWSTVEAPDGRPCLSYDFRVVPIRHPWRFR